MILRILGVILSIGPIPIPISAHGTVTGIAITTCRLIHDPFLDHLVHFQSELPLPYHSFQLEPVELREEQDRNQEKSSWSIEFQPSGLTRTFLSSQTISLAQLSKYSHLTHLVHIENTYNGPDIMINGEYFGNMDNVLLIELCYGEPLGSVDEGAGLAFPSQSESDG